MLSVDISPRFVCARSILFLVLSTITIGLVEIYVRERSAEFSPVGRHVESLPNTPQLGRAPSNPSRFSAHDSASRVSPFLSALLARTSTPRATVGQKTDAVAVLTTAISTSFAPTVESSRYGRLLVHVGPSKTGTSTFQKVAPFLLENVTSVKFITHTHTVDTLACCARKGSSGLPRLAARLKAGGWAAVTAADEKKCDVCFAKNTVKDIEATIFSGRDVIFSCEGLGSMGGETLQALFGHIPNVSFLGVARMPAITRRMSALNQITKIEGERFRLRELGLPGEIERTGQWKGTAGQRNALHTIYGEIASHARVLGANYTLLSYASLERERGGLTAIVLCRWLRFFGSLDQCAETTVRANVAVNPSVPFALLHAKLALHHEAAVRGCKTRPIDKFLPTDWLERLPKQIYNLTKLAYTVQEQGRRELEAVRVAGGAMLSCTHALDSGADAHDDPASAHWTFTRAIKQICDDTGGEWLAPLRPDVEKVSQLRTIDIEHLAQSRAWRNVTDTLLYMCNKNATVESFAPTKK